jgi:hypothetical protein
VGGNDELRPIGAAAAAARADDVAFLVDVGVRETRFTHLPEIVLRARLLLERRRGDLVQAHLLLEHARAAVFQRLQ